MKIIFQDIDGPLIPLRMYYTGDRRFSREQGSFLYDPIAVGMLDTLCSRFGAQIVFNSAHCSNPPEQMLHQATVNGMFHLMHPDISTEYMRGAPTKFNAIERFLKKHDVERWIVIDDDFIHASRQVQVDFKVGMSIDNFYRASELLDGSSNIMSRIIGVNGIS